MVWSNRVIGLLRRLRFVIITKQKFKHFPVFLKKCKKGGNCSYQNGYIFGLKLLTCNFLHTFLRKKSWKIDYKFLLVEIPWWSWVYLGMWVYAVLNCVSSCKKLHVCEKFAGRGVPLGFTRRWILCGSYHTTPISMTTNYCFLTATPPQCAHKHSVKQHIKLNQHLGLSTKNKASGAFTGTWCLCVQGSSFHKELWVNTESWKTGWRTKKEGRTHAEQLMQKINMHRVWQPAHKSVIKTIWTRSLPNCYTCLLLMWWKARFAFEILWKGKR